MTDEPNQPAAATAPTHRGRRYRRRELALADGARRTDGSIEHRDAAGAVTETWAPDDAAWPDHAIRFGIRPQTDTVRPDGHRGKGPNPPAW